jgi:hypothetical protein
MSIQVGLDEIREQVAACRSCAYLLTVNDDGSPHAVSLRLDWHGDELIGGAGRRTAGNVERCSDVSLLWPTSSRDGYALFVNGRAEVRLDGDAATVAVKPTGAVLHKTPDAGGEGPSCVRIAEG